MTSNASETSSTFGRRIFGPVILLLLLGAGFATALYLIPLRGSTAAAADPAPATAATTPDKPKKKEVKKQQKMDEAEQFFQAGTIPQLRITIAKEDMDKLRANGRLDVGCNIKETIGGKVTEYLDVAVHIKGSAGSLRGIDDKPGLTLSFDKFKEKQEFHGLAKINLNNGAQDGTFMVENLGNALFRDAGIPGCRCTNARVWINERDFGIYVLKEGFDDAFLKRFFEDPDGTLYEGGFVKDINEGLVEKVNTNKRDITKIKELIAASTDGDAAKRRARLEKVVDLDRFHTFMAMEGLTAHWDGYTGNRNNYRVYFDPAVGKVIFLPHGMDQLFQQPDYPIQPGNSSVAQALCSTPEDRAKYLERVAELREKVLTPENVNKHIDRISGFLAAGMKEVSPDMLRQHEEHTKQLRSRVLERIKGIDRQLNAIPKPMKFGPDGAFPLVATKWEDKPESGDVKIERVTEAGKPLVRIKSGGPAAASIRQAINLPHGKYTFEGMAKLAGVTIAEGTPNAGVGLRVSGGQRTSTLRGTADWTKTTFDIDVPEPARDVVLVVEFRVTAGEATFDLSSLKLRKR